MAITGIVWMGYVPAMIGNLKAFLGPVDLDHYAEFLASCWYRSFPAR